jgi:hypothetical protein
MGRRQGANPNRLPLHHFLRLIAGGRIMEHGERKAECSSLAGPHALCVT